MNHNPLPGNEAVRRMKTYGHALNYIVDAARRYAYDGDLKSINSMTPDEIKKAYNA